MSGWIDTQEAAIIDLFLRATAWTLPAALHVGLSTTTPTEAGANFTEPVGNNYGRVSKTRNGTEWASAVTGDPTIGDNATAVTFPTASGSWGTVTHFGLFDAVSAGNLLFWGALTTSKAINNGDTAEFAIGALDVKLGDPGDSY